MVRKARALQIQPLRTRESSSFHVTRFSAARGATFETDGAVRIVIIGGGQIGSSLARTLAPDHEVVVIDHDRAVGDVFTSIDAEFIVGSGTSEEVLARAGIDSAEFFVACTGLDEVNIVACALANRIASPQTICLVSRADFVPESQGQLEQFGIDRVLWPEAQLAADIEQVVIAHGAIDAEAFAGGQVRLLEYKLGPGSPLVSASLGQLHLPRGALIVAVKREGRLFVPRGATELASGDKIIVMGTPEAMQQIERLVSPARHGDRVHVTIIGGGDVGLQLAERLEQTSSITLRIVEASRDRGELLAARLSRTLVPTWSFSRARTSAGATCSCASSTMTSVTSSRHCSDVSSACRKSSRALDGPPTCGCSSASASTWRCRRAEPR